MPINIPMEGKNLLFSCEDSWVSLMIPTEKYKAFAFSH